MPDSLGCGVDMLRRVDVRILLSAGVVAVAAALAGLSTWATFTDSTSTPHSIATGVVDIDLGASGTPGNRLDVAAEDMAPGDTVERALTLSNSSTIPLARVTLTTSLATNNLLGTDATHGLRLSIERCPVPWLEMQVLGAYTYACLPGAGTVLASSPVALTAQTLTNVSLAAGGSTNYLRVRLALPSTAGNAFQQLANEVDMTFTGVQRASTDR